MDVCVMDINNPYILLLIPVAWIFVNKKNYLYLLSLTLLLVAFAQISLKEKQTIKYPSNKVYLLLDESYSMSCNDLKPNRLEYAKKQIKRFLDGVNKDFVLFTFDKFVHPIATKKDMGLADMDRFVDALGDDVKFARLAAKKLKKYAYLDTIKIEKTGTDIKSAIDSIDAIDRNKKIIIVASDGGEKEVEGDFIFWGFATKEGAKVPGYEGVSKLNIIGSKYFRYDEVEKLVKYINSLNVYSTQTVKVKKDISPYFTIPAALLFLAALIRKYLFVIALAFVFVPHSELKANDTLGCIYQFFGFHQKARKEFQKGSSDLAKLKTAIYYIIDDKCEQALPLLESIQSLTKQKEYDTALCLVRQKRYKEAYEKLRYLHREYTDDKKIAKFYNTLRRYEEQQKRTTIIYQAEKKMKKEKTQKPAGKKAPYSIKKENPW